jgi:soluble lytic murein transglycosylase-like protein
MRRFLLAATLAAVPGLAKAQATPACAAAPDDLTLQQMIDECDSWRSLDLPPGSPAAEKFGDQLDALEARLKAPNVTPPELDALRAGLYDWKISVAKDSYRGPMRKGRLGAAFCSYVNDETQRAAVVASISRALSQQSQVSLAAQAQFDSFFSAPAPFDGGSRPSTSAVPTDDSSVVIAPAAPDPNDPERYKKVRQILIYEGASPRIVDAAIREALRQHKDPLLVLALINSESGFHKRAHSSAGALGLMQIMPGTGKALGVTTPSYGTCDVDKKTGYDPTRDPNSICNPTRNLHAGIRYLGSLWSRFADFSMTALQAVDPFSRHDVKEVVAAYNAGPGAVDRFGGVPPYRETQKYVRRVLGYYSKLKTYLVA